MSKIIKRLQPEVTKRTAARCRERGIVLPTFAQLRNPELIPPAIKRKLKGVGLGFLLVTSGVRKADFEEIRLRVEPDFYFIGHHAPTVSICIRPSFSGETRLER